MLEFVLGISHYALPVLAVAVLALCFAALLRRKAPSLGKVKLINTINGDSFPIVSRETSIGRHKNCDIILNYPTVSRLSTIIVCTKNGCFTDVDIEEGLSKTKNIQQMEVDVLAAMTGI